MAELYLAERVADPGGARVVVKCPLPGTDASYRALLWRELAALGAIDSRHVVRLLGGATPGAAEPYLILEHVDGCDLGALLLHERRHGRLLPLDVAFAVLRGLLLGLTALHEATDVETGAPLGLVHRDVNPANVLLSRAGDVKVADLGVVRVRQGEEPTVGGGFKGTLSYMAPEQLVGEEVDPRTDVFAVGLVAYELLTGTPARPPGNASIGRLLEARRRLPAPPRSLRPELPEAVDEVVLWALEPDPRARPASAAELLDALEATALVPNVARLAAHVSAVEAPSVPAVRTLGPEPERTPIPVLAPQPPASISATTAQRAGTRPWLLLAGAGGAAVLVSSAFWPSDAAEAPEPEARAAVTEPAVERRGPAGDDARAVRLPLATAAPVESAPSLATPVTPRRPSEPETARRSRVATARPRGPAAASVTNDALRVAIAAMDAGPVYVSGAGVRGLAPQRTAPLTEQPSLLELRAGAASLPITLRLTRGSRGVLASIGAPSGRFYDVQCDGRDVGPTPVLGLSLAVPVSCRVQGAAGERAAFRLATVSE